MRNVPDMSNRLLFFVNEKTPESYHDAMDRFEIQAEGRIIDFLKVIGIHASVKTDRKSLPYQKEIHASHHGSSYLNDAFDLTQTFYREIVRELLEEDIRKIRFYVLAEIYDGGFMGKTKFSFRYYVHH